MYLITISPPAPLKWLPHSNENNGLCKYELIFPTGVHDSTILGNRQLWMCFCSIFVQCQLIVLECRICVSYYSSARLRVCRKVCQTKVTLTSKMLQILYTKLKSKFIIFHKSVAKIFYLIEDMHLTGVLNVYLQ